MSIDTKNKAVLLDLIEEVLSTPDANLKMITNVDGAGRHETITVSGTIQTKE